MADGTAVTPGELADEDGLQRALSPRMALGQAAAGYVEYDADDEQVQPQPRAGMAFADEDEPGLLRRRASRSCRRLLDRRAEGRRRRSRAARASAGTSTASACSAAPSASSAPATTPIWCRSWIPALDGVKAKLERREGRRCRLRPRRLDHPDGAAPIPKSQILRLRLSRAVDRAARKRRRKEAGVARTRDVRAGQRQGLSRRAATTSSPSSTACTTWAIRSARGKHVRETLAPDGDLDDRRAVRARRCCSDNLNPVGRLYLRGLDDDLHAGLAGQEVGLGLGAQAGEARLRKVAPRRGFTRFRRATETPFNMVFEARA